MKFNRYKHKNNEWATIGILKSIKFRDKLYELYWNAPPRSQVAANIKTNLTYNKILKSTIRTAKQNHFSMLFEKYKSNMKLTWRTINDILHRKNASSNFPDVFLINDVKISDEKKDR